MALLSVAQAAKRLGVSVQRVHQRIAAGALPAQRVGSQWVIDERALWEVSDSSGAGRPVSARSAWAMVALSVGDNDAVRALAPSVRSRVRHRLTDILSEVERLPEDEREVQAVAVRLRSVFRNLGKRRVLRASPLDLSDLRTDRRWTALVDPAETGISTTDVEGYLAVSDVEQLTRDFLLVDSPHEANVVIHVLPADQAGAYPDSKLRLAVDLALHRGPREEARTVELLHELAQKWRHAAEPNPSWR